MEVRASGLDTATYGRLTDGSAIPSKGELLDAGYRRTAPPDRDAAIQPAGALPGWFIIDHSEIWIHKSEHSRTLIMIDRSAGDFVFQHVNQ